MHRTHIIWLVLIYLFSYHVSPVVASPARQSAPTLSLLGRNGAALTSLTDGDLVSLRLSLNPVQVQSEVEFYLDQHTSLVARCTIPAGDDTCTSDPFPALGWYWLPGGGAAHQHRLVSRLTSGEAIASLTVTVKPRPVVMVHGFSSNAMAWSRYLGPDGYLEGVGIPGFAVGDGQVAGVMNTGDLQNPLGNTNTIAENAEVLGSYINEVKARTGAQQVDLLAHSMGGMISRYYIDRVMAQRDIAQLIMLGTPALGSACAALPASLGYYLPATLEIRPVYAATLFNPQITRRHGIPFHALAGIPIIKPVGSPCTGVPSDLVVSLQSVTAIPLDWQEMPVLHTDLNTSQLVFEQYVKPLLLRGPGEYHEAADPPAGETPVSADPAQYSRIYHGQVRSNSPAELVIPIEPGVQVASFALYDPSRSLNVTVRGASGNVIDLNPDTHGLIEVDDPESLLYLGYGFAEPRPGVWRVTLQTTEHTPPGGTDYAITARFIGGVQLVAQADPLVSRPGEAVHLHLQATYQGEPVQISTADAQIYSQSGEGSVIALTAAGDAWQADWQPNQPGFYSLDLSASGVTPEGSNFERRAELAILVQPQENQPRALAILIAILAGILLLVVLAGRVLILVIRRLRRKRAGTG